MMQKWRIVPMLQRHDWEISTWRYTGELSYYNTPVLTGPDSESDAPVYEGWAVLEGNGAVAGFFYFGPSCRIPTNGAYRFADGWMDFGLGLRPDLCGKGCGADFVRMGLEFAREQLGARKFRLCVAAFNARARHIYEKCGFAVIGGAVNSRSGDDYFVMTLDRENENKREG